MELTYDEFINNILETRGRFACGKEYHEKHHIRPKCMGGTDEEDNLIDLFAREHFEAHRLLVLENLDVKGLVYAWHRMSNGGNDKMQSYKLNSEEYEEMKKVYSELRRKETTGIKQNKETIEKRASKLRGRPCPEHVKQVVKKAMTGRVVSKETRNKISKSLKGKYIGENSLNFGRIHSNEARQRMSEAHKGNVPWNKGKMGLAKHSDDTKRKISESSKGKFVSEETKRRIAEALYKQVLCIETNIIYDSIQCASNKTSINRSCISNVCRGKQKTAGGYHWKFV